MVSVLGDVDACRRVAWSPDGETVAMSIPSAELGGSLDIWFYSIEEETGKPFLATAANEHAVVFSPDGKRLAYQSDESGEYNVYVRPLSGSGAPSRVSPDGGASPEWRRDGRELFYMRPDGTIMAVEGDSSFGEPTELFRVTPSSGGLFDLFDVTPDRESVLVLEQDGPPVPLTLIQNWTALLER